MNNPRPSDIARAYLDAFGSGDVAAALALLTDDVVWHVDGAPEVPTVGLRQGRARVKEWMEGFPESFEPLGFRISAMADCGSTALATGWFRYRVRATQRTVEGDFTIRFEVRDGRISHYQIYEDSLALAQAFQTDVAAPDPDARRLRVNDTVYAYEDVGEGPVVLFLHGLFLDRTIFRSQARELAQDHRCVSVDLPGHGQSTWPIAGWTLDDIADDIALMVQERGWGRVALVGHSQGGMVALRLTARHPGMVDRLALLGTSARAEPADRREMWQRRRALLGERGEGYEAEGTGRTTLAEEIQAYATHPDWRAAHPEAAQDARRLMEVQDGPAMQHALDSAVLGRSDIRRLLPDIHVPALVVAGRDDTATPLELSAEIADLLPRSRLEVLDHVAHHAPLESPERVSALLADFLREE
ncbi:alpha/beta fold hydrolase [Streptomyces sp. NPDC048436]|uniref:alpha/beta fold hydrolase n=1 Tax=Streptomyces sp. NPDC048436 TaxID=3365550 RepID=UPI00371FC71B